MTKTIKRYGIPGVLAFVVAMQALAPLAVVQAATFTSFNAFAADKPLLRISNHSDNPGCSECWKSSISDVEDGDTISFLIYYHNSGRETAYNTRARISAQLNSGRESGEGVARIWADNAGSISGTARFYMADGQEVERLDHQDTLWYPDQRLSNPNNLSDDITTGAGENLGDIEFGWDTQGYIVVRYKVIADDDDDEEEEEEEEGELDVTTLSATNIDEDSARLRCDIETGDEDADVWFEYGEDDDDLDEDTKKVSVDDNEDERVEITISGLDEDKRYFYRCVAEDDDGNEEKGSIRDFRTDDDDDDDDGDDDGERPDVVTLSATSITDSAATLRGSVDPNNDDTDAWFEWGVVRTNLNRDTSEQDVGDGDRSVDYDTRVSGLVEGVTYYYRAVAENDEGIDRGVIRSFRAEGGTTTNIVTRFIDIFRTTEVEEEPDEEVLIVTLDSNKLDTDRDREIRYIVSYENRTNDTLTNALLRVDIPRELEFLDSDPNFSEDSRGELVFRIGTIRPGDRDDFTIDTRLERDVDDNDSIIFTAQIEYEDASSIDRKVVRVIDNSTFSEEARGGAFTALIADSLGNFFGNPILWLILLIALVYFAIRYLTASRERRTEVIV